MRIERVLTVPLVGELTASTMYIVKAAQAPFAEIYFSTKDATALVHVPTVSDINSLITTRMSEFQNAQVAADIAARDALVLGSNALVLVLDASADPTVDAGAALYFYTQSNATWHKVSEFESLDLNVTWDSLVGKPSSSALDIDDAVSRRHSHTNLAVLNDLTDTANVLTYKGLPVGGTNLAVNDW